MVKHLAEKPQDKSHSYAVPEPARPNCAAVVLEVRASLQMPLGDEILWIPLGDGHTGPDFRNEQTDVVIDSKTWTDVARSCNKNGVTSQQVGDKRGVEVDDRWQRIEWSLRERTLRAGARSRRRSPGHAANKLHEELRQLEVVNRIKNGQRANLPFRRIIT